MAFLEAPTPVTRVTTLESLLAPSRGRILDQARWRIGAAHDRGIGPAPFGALRIKRQGSGCRAAAATPGQGGAGAL
eukprot:Skav200285  [mRNA]  locus=scaffold2127:109509:111149:+ [translate_table: standard]